VAQFLRCAVNVRKKGGLSTTRIRIQIYIKYTIYKI